MSKQVHRFSLEEILTPKRNKVTDSKKIEKPISENVATLLSNVSKTIGIIAYERKVALKKESQIPLPSKTV